MSDEGFHEIQLSGKQLVFLFMSGVVLLVVVFLLGVDVGRGVRNAMGDVPMSAEAAPPATALTEEPVASAEPGKAAEPELSYHEMLLGEGAPPATDPAKPTASYFGGMMFSCCLERDFCYHPLAKCPRSSGG